RDLGQDTGQPPGDRHPRRQPGPPGRPRRPDGLTGAAARQAAVHRGHVAEPFQQASELQRASLRRHRDRTLINAWLDGRVHDTITRTGRASPHFAPRYSIAAPMRHPNAAVDVIVRTRFHADHLASLKCRRTSARSPTRAGLPAALSTSLSGTLTARVMTTAMRYRMNAAPIHGSTLRLSPLRWRAVARPVRIRAPK